MHLGSILLLVLSLAAPFTFAASPIQATLDLRPSWSSTNSDLRAENQMELSYQFSEQFSLSYVQEFNTPFAVKDGYIKIDNAIAPRLRIETWTIFPTSPVERERTLNVGFRPIVGVMLFGDFMRGVEISESIVTRWYRERLENSPFENRMELTPQYSFFGDELIIKMPIVWQALSRSAGWEQLLWLNPEVTYAIDEHVRLGLAYYSESLVSSDGFRLLPAIEQGTFQMVLQASI